MSWHCLSLGSCTQAVAAPAAVLLLCDRGIHPDFSGQTYLDILAAAKQGAPDIHVHAFSPLEVLHVSCCTGLISSSRCNKYMAHMIVLLCALLLLCWWLWLRYADLMSLNLCVFILQGATTLGMSLHEFLAQLKAAGLGSLPGTAAEVLDQQVSGPVVHFCCLVMSCLSSATINLPESIHLSW